MSAFWNASEPPAVANIVAWCEAEVETACMDLMANVILSSWMKSDGSQFRVYPYAGGDWDLEAAESANQSIADLITEAADSHICWYRDADKRGIYGEDAVRMETALQEIETAIAGVRALLRSGEPPAIATEAQRAETA